MFSLAPAVAKFVTLGYKTLSTDKWRYIRFGTFLTSALNISGGGGLLANLSILCQICSMASKRLKGQLAKYFYFFLFTAFILFSTFYLSHTLNRPVSQTSTTSESGGTTTDNRRAEVRPPAGGCTSYLLTPNCLSDHTSRGLYPKCLKKRKRKSLKMILHFCLG